MYQKNKGFTLIELLVAVAILSTLIILVYQALEQVRRANDTTRLRCQQAARLQKAITVLDGDFKQIADRKFRSAGRKLLGNRKINWGKGLLGGQGNGLVFTRVGWINHQWQSPRGEVIKVGYRLQEGRLERIWWPYPDTPVGEDKNYSLLLNRVADFRASFYFDGEWVTEWSYDDVLPQAISLQFDTQHLGHIERIYLIPSLDNGKRG